MSVNNEEVTEPSDRKCENPHCLDGYVDQAGSNQEGTELWVDQVPCQVCNPEEADDSIAPEKYLALTIYPDHGEVIARDAPDEALCRTQDHDQARFIAKALNENERLRSAIATHRSQKADDRCIEDDDRLYEALRDGIKCDRRVGDKEAMLRNCARFIDNRCEAGGWPSYKEIEEQNEKAKRAIAHVLKRIAQDQETRHAIGFGTESFQLLTEAAAALFDEPLEKLVSMYTQGE